MNKTRILLVDDDIATTRLLQMRLEKTGAFEVRSEHRGARALPVAREFLPDLVVLDVNMPEVDGGDVAAQLQADPVLRAVPVIFLTALVAHGETVAPGAAQGGQHFLAKPVDLASLLGMIARLLPGARVPTAPA